MEYEVSQIVISNTEPNWDVYIDENGDLKEKDLLGYYNEDGNFVPIHSEQGLEARCRDGVDDRNSLQYNESFCKKMTLNFLKAKRGGFGNIIRHRYGPQKMELLPIDTPKMIGLERSDQGTVLVCPTKETLSRGLIIGGIYGRDGRIGRQIKSSQVLTQLFDKSPSVTNLDVLIEREKEIIKRSFAIILRNNIKKYGVKNRWERESYEELLKKVEKVRSEIMLILTCKELESDIIWDEKMEIERWEGYM
ncbi:MAG: hypothetical protein PHH70_01085 [Candidatus Gracilibacteria bacterium]|nr:hypothetical protein [Candidatus Gracilibacteria bacterium]